MLSFALHKIVGKESSGARSGPEHSLELEKGGCVAVKGGGSYCSSSIRLKANMSALGACLKLIFSS